jgi:hypothetical protein
MDSICIYIYILYIYDMYEIYHMRFVESHGISTKAVKPMQKKDGTLLLGDSSNGVSSIPVRLTIVRLAQEGSLHRKRVHLSADSHPTHAYLPGLNDCPSTRSHCDTIGW